MPKEQQERTWNESPFWDMFNSLSKRQLVSVIERDDVVGLAKQIDLLEFLREHDLVEEFDNFKSRRSKTPNKHLLLGVEDGVRIHSNTMKNEFPVLWDFIKRRDFSLMEYRVDPRTAGMEAIEEDSP